MHGDRLSKITYRRGNSQKSRHC